MTEMPLFSLDMSSPRSGLSERYEPVGDAAMILAIAWTIGACLAVSGLFVATYLAGLVIGIGPS